MQVVIADNNGIKLAAASSTPPPKGVGFPQQNRDYRPKE
jgi:hypothetical protein